MTTAVTAEPFVLTPVDFDGLCIGNTPLSECRIVLSKDANAAIELLADTLNKEIEKVYGQALPIVDDSAAPQKGEIVFGKTTRKISENTAGLSGQTAAMEVLENAVALDAASTAALRSLVTWFQTNYIVGKPALQLTADHSQRGNVLSNPVRSTGQSGDPCIRYDAETGYYYALYSAPKNDRVILYRVKNIADLATAIGKELYVAGEHEEVKHKLYAPEIVKVDGKWYIYASGATSMADKNKSPSTSIRLFCLEATGDDPYGDYVFKAWLDDTLFAIDAHVFSYEGKNYIACARISGGNQIAVAELKNPWTINRPTIRTIATATLPFETRNGKINEGPFTFVAPNGKLYMLYSANNVTSDYYCLGLLEFAGGNIILQKNWKKVNHAVFEGTAQIKSPGHCSVFMSPDGTEYWLAYHFQSSGRKLGIGKITFDETGAPVFGTPSAPFAPFFAPSGEQ